jgi:exonuclease VII small subunit
MGKYDSLSNLKKMAEKISNFEVSVDDALQKFKKTIQILEDIDVIDAC